jgi:branched-chain amino acid transport system ATP-binding protein
MTQAKPPLLEVRDLHVRLGGSHILQGVDFDVAPVGVTGLLGRNGVGKTTTLRAVLSLVPKTGSVRLDGEDISAERTHDVVRRGVGYVPEDREVFAGLTVAENLRLAARVADPDYELVHDLFPELRQRRRQPAGTLSGGQQQMLSLARALLNDNRLLIVDEPTKGLAPRVVSELADALERAAEVAPILLVEQNLGLVTRLAEGVVVMAEGRVVHRGPGRELFAEPERTRSLLGVARKEVAPG